MLYIILQIIAFQALFLLVYDLFLKRETFFNYNRVYLIVTALLSMVLPFVKWPTLKTMAVKDAVIHLPEVFIGTPQPTTEELFVAEQAGIPMVQPEIPIWQTILFLGSVLAMVLFLNKIFKIIVLKKRNPKKWHGNVLIVNLLKSSAAFSFFNTIFLGERIPESEKTTIYKHELIHVNEYHTIDLLFFEILRIAIWFNPLVYLYQNRIKDLHEFIADSKAVKEQGKTAYYQNLLNQVFDVHNVSITNTFFKKSLIKKRIAMLQKSKSKQIKLIKYALLIPMVLGMLIYTSTEVRAQQRAQNQTKVSQELTDEELIKKYYDEIIQMEENGATFIEIAEYAGINSKESYKYIQPRVEFLKLKAATQFVSDKSIQRKSEKGTLTDEDFERAASINNKLKTYSEYRAWKKTKEAKTLWEASARNGELRLFVEDIQNKTEKEQKRYDALMKQIENNKNFDKLIVADENSLLVLEDFKSKNNEEPVIRPVAEFVEVPYSTIENVPYLPECQDIANNDERKKCVSSFISSHVNKNFNLGIADSLDLYGRQRIFVSFKIDKNGDVVSVGARARHPALETEAIRVVESLPKFIPGRQKGKTVTVPYSLPIVFEIKNSDLSKAKKRYNELILQRDRILKNSSKKNPVVVNLNKQIDSTKRIIEKASKVKNERKKQLDSLTPAERKALTEKYKKEYLERIERNENKTVVYDEFINDFESKIDEPAYHPDCKSFNSIEERKKCTTEEVTTFVNENFNTKIASTLELKDNKIRVFTKFTVDENGEIIDVEARSLYPVLQKEAVRVIKSLPQFIPGKQNGKFVKVPFSLPIYFDISDMKNKKSKN